MDKFAVLERIALWRADLFDNESAIKARGPVIELKKPRKYGICGVLVQLESHLASCRCAPNATRCELLVSVRLPGTTSNSMITHYFLTVNPDW